jgi:hypothetical protein
MEGLQAGFKRGAVALGSMVEKETGIKPLYNFEQNILKKR